MTQTGPFRLPSGGRLIDRAYQLPFRFDGRHLRGLTGDTLASALLANGQMLMGRSFKYHRPRGPISCGVEEPNALLGLGQGGRFEPNQRATTTPLVAVTRKRFTVCTRWLMYTGLDRCSSLTAYGLLCI